MSEMLYVYVVEGLRQYGDSWVEDIFDSQEKALAFIESRLESLDEEDDLMFRVNMRIVK